MLTKVQVAFSGALGDYHAHSCRKCALGGCAAREGIAAYRSSLFRSIGPCFIGTGGHGRAPVVREVQSPTRGHCQLHCCLPRGSQSQTVSGKSVGDKSLALFDMQKGEWKAQACATALLQQSVTSLTNDVGRWREPVRARRIGSPPRYSTPLIAQMSPPWGRKWSNITHLPSGDQTG